MDSIYAKLNKSITMIGKIQQYSEPNFVNIIKTRLRNVDPESKYFLIKFFQHYTFKCSQETLKNLAKQFRTNDRVVSRALNSLVEQKILCRTESRKGRGRPRSHYFIMQTFSESLDKDATLKNDAYEDIIKLLLDIHEESEGIDKNLSELNKRTSSKLSDSERQLLDLSKRFFLSASERLLLALLFTHADHGGLVKNFSFQQLMNFTGMSKRRILNQLEKLKKYNFIYKYNLDFQGICFFESVTGTYSLNLTHPYYGQYQLKQRYVVLSYYHESISTPMPEASQLLNIRKNDYELNFNRNWPVNIDKKQFLYPVFLNRIELIQNEIVSILVIRDALNSLLKVNNRKFEQFLQSRLEQYALTWLNFEKIIIGKLQSTGSIIIPDQITKIIRTDLVDDNKFGDIEYIIELLGIASLAIALNYYMSLSSFFYDRFQFIQSWHVNFLTANENSAAAPLVIIYTRQPLIKGMPQYATLPIEECHYNQHNVKATWLIFRHGERVEKFEAFPNIELPNYTFIPKEGG